MKSPLLEEPEGTTGDQFPSTHSMRVREFGWKEFYSDPEKCVVQIEGGRRKSFSFSIRAKFYAPSQAYANKMAKALLKEHLRFQFDNIGKCVRHEINNSPKADTSKAVNTIHYRIFEAYACWCEKHFIPPEDNRHQFAEILLYRVVQSISEHIFYCPERIVQVIHSILRFKNEIKKGKAQPYIIDMLYLHRGLDRVHACEWDILNFDDINQCGSMNITTLRKAWHESTSIAVCIDILRMYYPVFFLKAWMFAFAIWLRANFIEKNSTDNFETIKYWLYVIQVDASAYLSVELLLYIYSFWIQERGQSWIRRSWQRLVGVVFGVIGVVWANIDRMTPFVPNNSALIVTYIFIGRFIIFIFYLPAVERWLERDRNFVKYGRVRTARKERIQYKLGLESTVHDDDFLPSLARDASLISNQTRTEIDDMYYENADPFSTVRYFCCVPCQNLRLMNWQNVFFWVIVTALTVFFEITLVSPIFSGYNFVELCVSEENPICPGMKSVHDIDLHKSTHTCVACGMSLICIYLLLALGSLIDLYLIFNFVMSLFGFIKGFSRGVAGLLIAPSKFSSRLWRGDESLLPYESTPTNSEPSQSGHSTHASQRLSPTERKMMEKKQSGTRLALICLFGTWENALEVWATICESLYERDLISFDESQDLRACFDKPTSISRHGNDQAFANNKKKEMSDLLSGMSAEPRERILYFLRTIRVLGREKANVEESDMNNWDAQEFLERCPSLSQIITTYTEDILKSKESLQEKTGKHSNLEHLIQKYKGEWRLFEQRMIDNGLFRRENNNFNVTELSSLLGAFLDEETILSEELINEIRLWASYRTQTVARTIRGALVYHDALKVYATWSSKGQNRSHRKALKLEDMVELIIAAQTYSSRPNKHGNNREDLEWLMRKWKDYPISIVYDLDKSEANNNNYHPNDIRDCKSYWEKHYGTYGTAVSSDSIDDEKNKMNFDFPFDYATCVKTIVNDQLELVNVLPRQWPLRLGKRKMKTQGKAANHLNASRKLWGHVTQVLDANMDGFIAEGFKLPFITHQFLSRAHSGRGTVTNRKNVHYRIIGFREYIYTHQLGGVASIMAATESTFGTICQRTLADPLGVRMHYGHPDFFDTFWLLNRGGPSKASPAINLSEDLFAGFNVWLRNEEILHVDTLEWQKGRETVFTTAAMFLTKISSGMIGAVRSRDMMDMHSGLGILTRFSLWCSSTGYWLTLVFLSIALQLYAVIFFLFSIANVSVYEVNLLNTTVSVQWFLGFGFATSFPFLAEQLLERGFIGLIKWIILWPTCTLFYLFQNQTCAASVLSGLQTGVAAYINTGRPSFFNSYTKALAYRLFVKSHYYPALTVVWLYSYHIVSNIQNSELMGNKFPLVCVITIVSFWLTGPIIFCPHTTDIVAMCKDWRQTINFFLSLKDSNNQEDSLYTFWKLNYRTQHDMHGMASRATGLVIRIFQFMVLQLLDEKKMAFYWGFFFIFMAYLALTLLWKVTCKNFTMSIIWMMGPIIVLIVLPGLNNCCLPKPINVFGSFSVVFVGAASGDWDAPSLIRVVLFIIGLRIAEDTLLLFFSILCRLCLKKKELRSNDEDTRNSTIESFHSPMVDIFYLVGFHYHVALYMAFLVFIFQFVFQVLLVLLGSIYKLFVVGLNYCGIGIDRRYMNLSSKNAKNWANVEITNDNLPISSRKVINSSEKKHSNRLLLNS